MAFWDTKKTCLCRISSNGSHEMFGVEPDTREFKNVISGLSRVKRAMLGKIGDGQRPCATYKGWSVIPTDYDLEKLNKDLTDDSSR